MPSPSSTPSAQAIQPKATAVLLALLLHVALIYGVQSGMLQPRQEPVPPVVLLSRLIELPQPKVAPAAQPLPTAKPTPTPAPPRARTPLPAPSPAPLPVPQAQAAQKTVAPAAAARVLATPSPQATPDAAVPPGAPIGAPAGAATVPAPATAAAAPAPSTALAGPASAGAQLPSSDADYLQNPKPQYPAISRRLNEQGKTMVRVLIGADGQPQRAEVGQSSGFARLDSAAVATAMAWRYSPGKRNGVPETMWFTVPIIWALSE